ncbi:MAG: hypothetical protein U0T73_14420 [Chitinophagales bacterium]
MSRLLKLFFALVFCVVVTDMHAQDEGKRKSKKPGTVKTTGEKDDLAPIGDNDKGKKDKPSKGKKQEHADGEEKKAEKHQDGEGKKAHDQNGEHKGKRGDHKKPHAESEDSADHKGGEKPRHGKPEREHHEAADSSKHRGGDKPTSKKPEPKKEEPPKPRPANVEVKVDDPIDRTRKGPSGQTIYTAPRGGKYYINASGNKVFVTNNTK